MNLDFIQANPDDAPFLAQMNKRLIEDERHRNTMSVLELEERMRAWLNGEYEAIYVKNGKEIVSYALYKNENDHFYLRQLYVEREQRRRGFGKALFAWLTEHRFSSKPIRLDVLTGNVEGRAFWQSVGFKEYCVTMERKSEIPS